MSGDGSTLFSRLRADGYGARALKWFCLLRHVRGVVWTISQSVEEKERERERLKKCVLVAREREKESQRERERGMSPLGCLKGISQHGGVCGCV